MRILKIRRKLLVFIFLIFSNTLFSQTQRYDETEVDSLVSTNVRKALNNLSTEKFQKEVFKNNTSEIPYRILLPKDFSTKEKYPLVITFHNSSRIGNDNESQLEPVARIWLREDIYNRFKCFVVAPQFNERSSNYVRSADGISISKPAKDVFSLLDLIDGIEKQYTNIDKSRIYLVGYSMGASTAQNLMNIAPGRFAALISIAAVPDLSNINEIKNKNIWLIHGKKDEDNPYPGSEALYKKLAGDKNLRFTTYTNLNHNTITIPFLETDEIPKWLFTKSK